jgi:glycosyltransferase involved in cell wall biosynthesis
MIVGDGPAKAELARQLPEGTRFLGHLSGHDLSTAIASADVLINPSTTEAFGNVNLEAMAAGLAVVSADSAETRRRSFPTTTMGLLVPPAPVEGYAESPVQARERPAKANSAGRGSCRRSSGLYAGQSALLDVVQGYLGLIS